VANVAKVVIPTKLLIEKDTFFFNFMAFYPIIRTKIATFAA